MDKEFIPYEQALALKELGFDEPCLAFYKSDKLEFQDFISQNRKRTNSWYTSLNGCTAPLYQQAFKWFREKYELVPTVLPYQELRKFTWDYNYNIVEYAKDTIYGHLRELTYEEAQLECLKKLIEIVKQQKS